MTLAEAALLGLIQGLTEFLPVSSTAHLVAAREWLGHPRSDDAFTTVVQLGTLVAVVAYFRADLWALTRGVLADVAARRAGSSPDARLAWLIAAGSVPVVVVGLTAKTWLKDTFYNLMAMGVVAIVFALLMLAAEVWARTRRPVTVPAAPGPITLGQAAQVGLWQALALMPGASRSGTTITGGLFAGLTRPVAARFSFLLSLPSIAGAGAKELYDEYKLFKNPELDTRLSLFASADEGLALGMGLVVSGVVGYVAIAGLLRFLTRYSLGVFVGYRLVFGGLLIAAALGGMGQKPVPPVTPPGVAG